MPAQTSGDDPRIYQFKVHLLEIRPMVWRRLLVLAGTTLAELHQILQLAMGWENYHLHRFQIHGRDFGDGGRVPAGSNERRIRLADFDFRRGEAFYYEYDFGDRWEHEVRIEKVLEMPGPRKSYPACTGGKRACPPEDCGGPWGYMDLLDVLKGKYHPDARMMREWVGRDFDPARFRRGPVNEALRRMPRI